MALKVSPSPADLNINMTNILKIENFLNDKNYSELIEYSANFNARLSCERRLRMPFLDPQTGVAQKHSNLYFKKSERLPGLKEGQIYTYPSNRWRCKKSNSTKFTSQPFYRFRASDNCTTMVASNHTPTVVPVPTTIAPVVPVPEADPNDFQALIDAESNSLGAADTDSKDSQMMKEESVPKEWYFDDMDANDVGSEEQADSDFEYNINGYKRKRKQVTARKSSRKPKELHTSEVKKSRSSSAASSSSRSRNRKSSSRSSKANSKPEGRGHFADVEPPSFADVEVPGELIDGAFRTY